MTIEQLVKKGKTEDDFAINELIKKFTPLILKMASSIYIKGYEKEDLVQIGYLSIIKSVKAFNIIRGSDFVPYVYNAIRKNYFNEIRKISKINYEISYEKLLEEGNHFKLFHIESTIEDSIIKKEELCSLKVALDKLTKEEKELIRFSYGLGHKGLKYYSAIHGIKYITAYKRKRTVIIKLRNFYTKIKE